MPTKKTVSAIKDEIRNLRLKMVDLDEQYRTSLYLETMPDYGPTYKYCYSTSNLNIPSEYQSVDSWLRAIAIHMSKRSLGHGGDFCDAIIISQPYLTSEKQKEVWLDYETNKLSKVARIRKTVLVKEKYKRGSRT